ncbi:MAG TPA: hypothetical protein EYP30_06950 [Archaeoglobaceae archaeon]|nr:hypothetical protein [Archaeoglobaceae archaeon]
MYYYHLTNYWDASDVSPPDNSSKLLRDLAEDTGGLRDDYNDRNPSNDIVIGWVKYADHNGIAYCNGFFSLGATDSPWFGWADWPHDSIAQHEISHLFNAGEGGFWCNEHPECIMNYCWASGLHGTDKWCDEHWDVVFGNINGLWE